MTMEIETLRTKKEELKCELEAEIQKEKSVEENIKILEEKLAIQDLEEKLQEKRESVRKLESIRADLENQYNQPKAEIPATDDAKENDQTEQSTGLLVQEEQATATEPVEPAEPTEKKKKHGFF